jgi:hypothetical protein
MGQACTEGQDLLFASPNSKPLPRSVACCVTNKCYHEAFVDSPKNVTRKQALHRWGLLFGQGCWQLVSQCVGPSSGGN